MKLAILNEQIGNLEKAASYYNILIIRPPNDSFVMSEKWTIMNNMGIISAKEGNLRAAIKNFKTVYDSTKSRKEFLESNVLSVTNLGHAYSILEKRDSAIFYLKIAENSVKAYHQPERYVQVIGLMASEIMKDKPSEAIAYVKEAIIMCDEMGYNPQLKAEMLKLLSDIYYDEGLYKESVRAMHEQEVLNKSIYNVNIAKEVNNLQAINELKESKTKVKELTLAKEYSQLQNNLGLVILVSLLILVITTFFYNSKIKKEAKKLAENYALLQNSDMIKDKLFSVIGHDLKGPIGNASMILDMYLDENVDEKEKEKILDILQNLLSSTYETLNKILVWGSSSIKGMSSTVIRFSPIEYIAANCKLIEASAFRKNITVTSQIIHCPELSADPSHFDFIIRNLLSNAVKFTNNNGSIVVSCTHSPDNGMVVFCVSDNGVGMKKEDINNLFSPSLTSHYGTNNEKGTGIGLTLCKEYIKENGGKIWVESEYGKGSSFYFSLKAA
jgi:signal transduction histidine kinase